MKDYEIGSLICDYMIEHNLMEITESDEGEGYVDISFTQHAEEQIGAEILHLLGIRNNADEIETDSQEEQEEL